MPPKPSHSPPLRRRTLLGAAGSALALFAPPSFAQPRPLPPGGPPLAIAQVVDMSPRLQDVGRDFLVGSRAAWQSINARGGLQGRPVRHLVFTTDGSAAGAREAWDSIRASDDCVAFSGCVGDGTLQHMAQLQAGAQGDVLAQIAPWAQAQDGADAARHVFGIFPGYQEQMAHALHSLATVGVKELGVAFADADLRTRALPVVERAATTLGLRVRPLPAPGASAPAPLAGAPDQPIVLFIGGTPELHAFARALAPAPGRHRYVVALADVNLQVLAQMGGVPRHTSVIATQAVPLLTASTGMVRHYRQALAKYYDEPPSPQGMAGFLAARYTAAVLQGVRGGLTRASVLQALQERSDVDVDGFLVRSAGRTRHSPYVTQTMLAADGRLIG